MTTVEQLLTRFMIDLVDDGSGLAELASGIRWEQQMARYRDRKTGRLVSERRVIRAASSFRQFTRDNIQNLTDRFLDGRLEIATWQERVAAEIKDARLVSHMAGRGGRNAMTSGDYGKVGSRLRFDYNRLDRFARNVANGDLTAAQIRANATLYGNATRSSFFDGSTRAKADAGFVYEQRFLGAGENCDDCIRYAAMGRVPVGTLPEPGDESVCRANCNCTKEYYEEGDDAEAF